MGVDSALAEQGLHAEGTGFIGYDGDDQLADFRFAQQAREHPRKHHGRRDFAAVRPLLEFLEHFVRRRGGQAGIHDVAPGYIAAERLPSFPDILHFGAVHRRSEIRRFADLVIRKGDAQFGTQVAQAFLVDHLLLMGGVLALAPFTQPVPLDRLGQDDRRRAPVFHCGLVRRVDLLLVVTAAVDGPHVLVGEQLGHFDEPGVYAEEVVPLVLAVGNGVLLVLSVDDLPHALDEQSLVVLSQQGIPSTPPDHLDDVPAGPVEGGFQFLYDLAVSPDGSVQTLQVAIYHEDQVVQLLTGRQGNGAQGFGLVRFSVPEECPYLAAVALLQIPVFQVPVEPGLVDGHDGAQSHGSRGEYPEIGHEPGMGIGGQPAARAQFAAEVVQVLFVESPFDIGPGVDTGRRVGLEEDLVAVVSVARSPEEMVEADFVEIADRSVRGDVAAEGLVRRVGAHDHGHGVPPDDVADPVFEFVASGIGWLLCGRDGVDVGRVLGERKPYALAAGVGLELGDQLAHSARTGVPEHVIQRFEPFQ